MYRCLALCDWHARRRCRLALAGDDDHDHDDHNDHNDHNERDEHDDDDDDDDGHGHGHDDDQDDDAALCDWCARRRCRLALAGGARSLFCIVTQVAILTNTFSNFDKYIFKFGQLHFALAGEFIMIWQEIGWG